MDAYRSAKQKRISRKQEKAAAAVTGGRTQANSGATRLGGGGDIRAPGYRIECKYTENQETFKLKLSDLQKLKKQAFAALEQPVLQVAFVDHMGRRTEFAFERQMGVHFASIYSATKTFTVHKSALLAHLTEGNSYAIRFADDNDSWIASRWSDFVLKVNKC